MLCAVQIVSVSLLAVGLSMDATAVSASQALIAERAGWREGLRAAIWFGGFQAAMPVFGWLAGASMGSVFEVWDHWIAFVLLVGIGAKMLVDVWRGGDEKEPRGAPFGARTMAPLAVATSIDALAAGVMLPVIGAPIAVSIATIGIVTAVFCFAAVLIGQRVGRSFGKRLGIVGGLVVAGLGVKILVEHTLLA
jgi:putative Mn2+ efflux pump MntP